MMSITVGQLASRYVGAAKRVNPEVERQLRVISVLGAGLVRESIENFHAVDTSTMLNSTTVESVGDNTYLIGPTVDYAVYVANGTSRVAARPFHIEAAKQLQKEVNGMKMDLGI